MIKDFLFDVCNKAFVSGFEQMNSDVLPKYFEKYVDSYDIDRMGSYIFKSEGTNDNKIMLTAHVDEIGMMVTDILDGGFLKFTAVGFINAASLVAQEVLVYGTETIFGVIGVNPNRGISLEEKNKLVKTNDLYIDTGLKKENLMKKVKIGDVATVKRTPCSLKNNIMTARGLDDKAGIAVMLAAAEELMKISHKSTIYYSAAVQEEGPGLGGQTTSYKINPDIGIVLDVGFGNTPVLSPEKTLQLGKGPGIALGGRFNPMLVNKFIEISEKYHYSVQYDVITASSGTDAESVQISREGIPCILLSIPLRYMHTAVETVDIVDIENMGRIIAMFINEIDNSNLEEMLCF